MRVSKLPFILETDVSLAGMTTLGIGGGARYLARAGDEAAVAAALAWAHERQVAVFVIGGGSNLLVADTGFDGMVLRYERTSLELTRDGETTHVTAAGGLAWDDLVARMVAAGLAGIECLSGIPGDVGAAPIQNIGAYGQEVAETLTAVEVVERSTGRRRRLAAEDCGFGYRTSFFKTRGRDRYVVTGVALALSHIAHGSVRYRELVERFTRNTARGSPSNADAAPSLAAVRDAVLAVRREKSMVLSEDDPNRRSAGSFFTNPVVTAQAADAVAAARRTVGGRAQDAREAGPDMPRFPLPDGRVKLSAGWLIEAAGFARGTTRGRVGLSTRHALALINRGGASAAEVVSFASEIRARVRERFGVTLVPEPALVGFGEDVESLLDTGAVLDRRVRTG